jgi:hypothetical protein
MLVALTPAGRERIDEAVETHVDNERQLLAGLSDGERQQLDQALRVDAPAGKSLTAGGDKVAVGADRHHGEKQSRGKRISASPPRIFTSGTSQGRGRLVAVSLLAIR